MAQGLIRPGSGPNRLPTLPTPTHARCSTAGQRVRHAPGARSHHCRVAAAGRRASYPLCHALPHALLIHNRAPVLPRPFSLSCSRSGCTRAEPPWPPPRSSRAELVAAAAGLLRPNRARHHHLQLEPPLLRPFPGHRGRRSALPPVVLRAWPPAHVAGPPRAASCQDELSHGCARGPWCSAAAPSPPTSLL